MSFRTLQFHFAALLVLSFSTEFTIADEVYDRASLIAATILLKSASGTPSCNPMIDPGCHIPVPGSDGPDGCTDCAPNSLLEALKVDQNILMPDNITINGVILELLQENRGTGTLFAVPSQ